MSLQEDAKKILPIIQAAADGKKIQYDDGAFVEGLNTRIFNVRGENCYRFVDGLSFVEPPKFRYWDSIKDVGESINDWFRLKNETAIVKIVGVFFDKK